MEHWKTGQQRMVLDKWIEGLGGNKLKAMATKHEPRKVFPPG